MNKRIMQMGIVVVLAMVGVGVAFAAESLGLPPTATEKTRTGQAGGPTGGYCAVGVCVACRSGGAGETGSVFHPPASRADG